MDLLWMILLLVLIQTDAQRVTEVRGQLGGNVTLSCSLYHWYMEVYRENRTCIGRTFGPDSSSYCSPDFESKYLMESNRLVVKKLTAEDSRLYLCGRKMNGSIHFEDFFFLTSESRASSGSSAERSSMTELIMYGSLSLNAAFMFAVTGLICALCSVRRTSRQQEDDQPVFSCESPQTVQYEEIQLPPSRAPPPECIYYKAQLPAAMLSPHRGTPGHLDRRTVPPYE